MENPEVVLSKMFGMKFFTHNERLCPECESKSYNTSLVDIPRRNLLHPVGEYVGDEFVLANPAIKYTMYGCPRFHKWGVNLEVFYDVGSLQHPLSKL